MVILTFVRSTISINHHTWDASPLQSYRFNLMCFEHYSEEGSVDFSRLLGRLTAIKHTKALRGAYYWSSWVKNSRCSLTAEQSLGVGFLEFSAWLSLPTGLETVASSLRSMVSSYVKWGWIMPALKDRSMYKWLPTSAPGRKGFHRSRWRAAPAAVYLSLGESSMILIDYRQIPRLNSFLFILMATLASHLNNASHLFPCLVESMYFPGLKFDP